MNDLIDESDVPYRLTSILVQAGFRTYTQLAQINRSRAALIKGIGPKYLEFIECEMKKRALSFDRQVKRV
ncbi:MULTISPECIES: hypothetical protein [unclassified Sinorhizobium]|uniref:hypothetical protein n=1 Tax=unclassified Sinorhizobium TaxID=2613772 RepID=UPI0035255B81